MNAVAGGTDDFRHVRPHGIEPKAGERSAIAGAGNRDLRGFGLEPRRLDDVRFPVAVSELLVFGIDGHAQEPLGAVLHTGKAAHAVKEQRFHVVEIVDVFRFLFVAVIDARLFDAVVAPGAVFPPIHHTVFADARPPRRDRVSFDVIFVRHNSSSQLQSGGGTQLGHDRLPAARKNMYSAQTIQSLELLDRFNADGQAFLPAVVTRFLSAALSRGKTLARIAAFLVRPSLRAASSQPLKLSISNTACV
ncbi:MAG: hypothetical protein NTW28_22910 [Candidatus Solibacter sp.]|nr:hypothetical protein [Candidatus Solibacter sp.]